MSDPAEKVMLTENLIKLLQCGVAPSVEELERADKLGIDVKKLKKVHNYEDPTT